MWSLREQGHCCWIFSFAGYGSERERAGSWMLGIRIATVLLSVALWLLLAVITVWSVRHR